VFCVDVGAVRERPQLRPRPAEGREVRRRLLYSSIVMETNDPYGEETVETGGQSGDAAAEIRQLREALEEKTREADAHQERYLRAAAEFDNARKRAARQREDDVRFANESLVRELLPVLDNFERALQAARGEPGAAAWTTGVELIHRELLRVLEKFG